MTRLIVVGTSTGGLAALRALLDGMSASIDAAVLMVQHIGALPSLLPELLSRNGIDVREARQGETLQRGKFLVAPSDRHLLVASRSACLSSAPREHYTRPAIDPLFRSAALAFGADVIGVILTGALDDGTAGLQAIKAMGGVTVVQDPSEAEAPGMPLSALEHCQIDHCVLLAEMGPLLHRLASTPPLERDVTACCSQRRDLAEHETGILLREGDPIEHLKAIASPSTISCPDCQGVLWALSGCSPLRFRCHTGHAYSAQTLEAATRSTSEDNLWKALRSLQERQALLEMIHQQERREPHGQKLAREIQALKDQADTLRKLIVRQGVAADEPVSE